MSGTNKEVPVVNPFLERFHADWRGADAGLFYAAIRNGAVTPAAVVHAVEAGIVQTLTDPCLSGASALRLRALLEAICEDRAAAIAFAQTCIERERLPRAERAAQKAATAAAAQREWMSRQPATDAQRGMILALGSSAVPDNRLEASDLIEKLQAMRAAR